MAMIPPSKKPGPGMDYERLKKQPNSPSRFMNLGTTGHVGQPPPQTGHTGAQPGQSGPVQPLQQLGGIGESRISTQPASNSGRQESTLGGGSYSNGSGGWSSSAPMTRAQEIQGAGHHQQRRVGGQGIAPYKAPQSEVAMAGAHQRYKTVGQGTPVAGTGAVGGTPIVDQGNGVGTTNQKLAAPQGDVTPSPAPTEQPQSGGSVQQKRHNDSAQAAQNGQVWVEGEGFVPYESAAGGSFTGENIKQLVDSYLAQGKRVVFDRESGRWTWYDQNGRSGYIPTHTIPYTPQADRPQEGDELGANTEAAGSRLEVPQLDTQELAKMEAVTRAQHAKQQARNIRGMMEAQAYAGSDADAGAGRIGDLQAQHALGAEAAVQVERLQAMKTNLAAQLQAYQNEHQRAVMAQNHQYAKELATMAAKAQAELIRLDSELKNKITAGDILGGIAQVATTAAGTYFGGPAGGAAVNGFWSAV